MALIECRFFSETLRTSVAMNVILPQATRTQIGMQGKAPDGEARCLYLLHGISDDHTTWVRRTSIERYAAPLGLAVVMPAVGRSFYTDMHHGYPYSQFVAEELPAVVHSLFRISSSREHTFVAGLSMGGYGAFKLALRYPERFAAAAALSGVLDIASQVSSPTCPMRDDFRLIFGDLSQLNGSEHDLFSLSAALPPSLRSTLRLYQCCGTQDFLYQDNLRFRQHAQSLGLPLTYEEGPGGHDWEYWDRQIHRVLQWLPPPHLAGASSQ